MYCYYYQNCAHPLKSRHIENKKTVFYRGKSEVYTSQGEVSLWLLEEKVVGGVSVQLIITVFIDV